MKINSVAVFCGSKDGSDIIYTDHASRLGVVLAQNNIPLVYGGGSKGLMGALANAMMKHNGKVIGIIPSLLVEWEHQHDGITELTVVEDMHVRKKRIYELCDAAIVLPGGFGTMDELFEMITWNQLSIHDKKIFLLNTDGFYDSLILHLLKVEQQGFSYEPVLNYLTIISEPEDILPHLGITDPYPGTGGYVSRP